MSRIDEKTKVFKQLIEAIVKVGQLDESEIKTLSPLLLLSDVSFIMCQEAAESLNETNDKNFEAKEIAKVISALSYMQEELGRSVFDEEELKERLPQFLEFNEVGKLASKVDDTLYKSLASFYTQGYNTERQWHESALIDTQVDFDSFIDIRPIFTGRIDEDEYTLNMNELLAMIIFRVAVQDDFGGIKSHTFQMTEEGFMSLELEVLRIREKLEKSKEEVINTVVSK